MQERTLSIIQINDQTGTAVPKAQPITPPMLTENRKSYQCIIDYDHQPFHIIWTGSSEYPDLTKFPLLENIDVSSVPQPPDMATLWKASKVINYGSHASIRITKHNRFPVLKLAHPDELSAKLLQHEFSILLELASLDLPVVKFDQQPILYQGVVAGYRMERLSGLELSDVKARSVEIKLSLDQLHAAGFSHGDFSPSNIMQNEQGHIVLIDFGLACRIGSTVPSFFPSWVYIDGIATNDPDLRAFDRFTHLM